MDKSPDHKSLGGDDPELELMIRIGRRATARVAELYKDHQRSGIAVEEKGPGDPVTAADREANDIICEALAKHFCDAAVVAEESVPTDAATLSDLVAHERVFYVDPVDGTAEFIKKTGEFAIMIGLAVRGRASAGVVFVPERDLMLAGRVGGGAFVERSGGERERLVVSDVATFEAARMVWSRSHTPPICEPLKRRLGVTSTIRCGSVGVKVALLALGEAELYVHDGPGLKRWDSCGPEAILLAAGGKVSDVHGQPIDYQDADLALRDGLLATNGRLYSGVLEGVKWAHAAALTRSPSPA